MKQLACFLIALFFTSSIFAKSQSIFTDVKTIDSVPVSYKPQSNEQINDVAQSVAYTLYDNTGAYIFYDEKLFEKIPDFSKFIILEHERAHHSLGHTLVTKLSRESGEDYFENAKHFSKHEKDADCEAGFKIKELFPETKTTDISKAMNAVFHALAGEKAKPSSEVRSRINTVITCFEGVLLPRPEVVINIGS